MAYVIRREVAECPDCGREVMYEVYGEDVAMYTGGMDDDGYPEIETVELHPGHIVKCEYCGYWDGEPPQY